MFCFKLQKLIDCKTNNFCSYNYDIEKQQQQQQKCYLDIYDGTSVYFETAITCSTSTFEFCLFLFIFGCIEQKINFDFQWFVSK